MKSPETPHDEAQRLAALYETGLLDTDTEVAFDDLAKLAATILNVPTAAVSLVDHDRQFFKASVNVPVRETPRDVSFCGHTILEQDLLIIPDALKDARFVDNPLREKLNIRFYAGTPLRDPDGHAMGALCVLDAVPRDLTSIQRDALRMLGRQVECQMNLHRMLRKIAASDRFARSTIDALSKHIAILDESGTIVASNLAWQNCARSPDRSLAAIGEVHANYLQLCAAYDESYARELVDGIRSIILGQQRTYALEYPQESAVGRQWFLARVSRFAGDGPIRVVVSHENVSDRRVATEQLMHDSRHDSLSGLPNRTLFSEQLKRCQRTAVRSGSGFAVMFLDLDRFKLINDSLGHSAGDEVLKTTAARIQSCLRSIDMVARLGGDEFAILIEQLTDSADAARVAERICRAVALPIDHGGNELTTTASIGIVVVPSGSCADLVTRDLLRDADAAMYKAKSSGKDRFVIFDAAMHQEVVTRMRLEGDLRKAIARGEMELHYQPILALRGHKPCGFEALIRWRRPQGLVSPGHFIPIAEDTGLIVAIGNWVLRQACKQLAQWHREPALRSLYVTINVSRKQLTDPQLLPTLQDVLRETGLLPQSLVLEITETALMENPAAALATLRQLKQVGVRLSIDDFGTGYSSLSCLQDYPIDLLKIDRSFVQNTADARQAAIVRTIIELAHHLKMTVVAEGVETPQQAALLEHSGCDLTQGYLFSRPLIADDARRFVVHSTPSSAAA